MKLIAFDLETTGLDPQRDQILQIGAVVFDHEDVTTPIERLPSFVTDVRHDRYEGNAFALQMNAWLLKRIATAKPKPPDLIAAMYRLQEFIRDNHRTEIDFKLNPVGFNVAAFDVAFVKAAGFDYLFHHRPIELGSLLSKDGLPVTSTAACKLINREVQHDALEDARDAVRLYRYWRASRALI